MDKKIFRYLKKYYINFDENKYNKLLLCKTDEELYNTFQKLWKKEHGGLYKIGEPFNPPENLPYYKDNQIIITDTGSKSKKFHKLYIKTLNELILNSKSNILNLNFCNNFGGKPQVMIAGLLPIFNNFTTNTILSYYYDKNSKRHYDVKKIDNKIICISNNKAYSIGSKKKYDIVELNIYYNEYTTSSAEQTIICLLSLSKYIKVNLIGEKSAGFTTVNKYIKLSNKYGIEIPIGYMGSKNKIFNKGL
jgi:hypothetical protein